MGIEKGKTPPTLIYSADEYVWYICNIDVTYFSTKSEMFLVTVCMYYYCTWIIQVLESRYKCIRDQHPFVIVVTYERIK